MMVHDYFYVTALTYLTKRLRPTCPDTIKIVRRTYRIVDCITFLWTFAELLYHGVALSLRVRIKYGGHEIIIVLIDTYVRTGN